MFEYFEGNYRWNLATLMVLSSGAPISEVDDVLRPLRSTARDAGSEATDAFWRSARAVTPTGAIVTLMPPPKFRTCVDSEMRRYKAVLPPLGIKLG